MERAMLRAVGMALSYSGGRKGDRARFRFLLKRKRKGPAVSSAGPLSSPFILVDLALVITTDILIARRCGRNHAKGFGRLRDGAELVRHFVIDDQQLLQSAANGSPPWRERLCHTVEFSVGDGSLTKTKVS